MSTRSFRRVPFRRLKRKATALSAVMISCVLAGLGQAPGDQYTPRAQKTVFVSCCDENWKNCKSTVVHGSVFVAPDGMHRAYVEVSAELGAKDSEGVESCHNTTTLFVSADGKSFKQAFEYKGEEGADGSGIQLIDWSADSNTLVTDLVIWKYFSEGWAHNLLIYSAGMGTIKKEPLNDLFSKVTKQPCMAEAELIGFLPDGRVVIRALPVDEIEDTPCVTVESTWAIDLSKLSLSAVAKPERVKPNGRFEESP
jgi:hypothetical protein